MNTLILLLAIIANLAAFFTMLLTFSLRREIENTEEGLKECATRTSMNKLHLDTLTNVVNKPKRKPGRPKKKVEPKIVHQLNGKQ